MAKTRTHSGTSELMKGILIFFGLMVLGCGAYLTWPWK